MSGTTTKRLKVLTFLAAMWALGAQAAEIRPLVKAGVDFGGDTMVTAVFSDGFTEEVRANDGFYIGGGAVIIDNARNMEYHLTLAYKFASIDGTDGDIEWSRIPLEALAFYRFSRVRLGGGLTYHINPRLEGDGSAGGLDVEDFKNALDQLRRRGGKRALAFCVSQRHADFMKVFARNTGLNVAAVHSGVSSDPR